MKKVVEKVLAKSRSLSHLILLEILYVYSVQQLSRAHYKQFIVLNPSRWPLFQDGFNRVSFSKFSTRNVESRDILSTIVRTHR
ncbi:hypothetical protein WN48_00820 [Eufriesea mexicana]|nr:hypothetical protein WN48_00820 [Eufriesea mexicana]